MTASAQMIFTGPPSIIGPDYLPHSDAVCIRLHDFTRGHSVIISAAGPEEHRSLLSDLNRIVRELQRRLATASLPEPYEG